jgi:DNA (cytosine-5)-methyltransferase 1
MGLDEGWVTNPAHELTLTQQLTALGNGVVPAQAEAALHALMRASTQNRGPQTATTTAP